jgi:Rrf2 family transcriptional regulator, cysteine metabolism repressor
MKFSTRTTYGLRAMINLAKNRNNGSLSLGVLAKQENISLAYLERLFAGLKKAGLIKAEKGAAGGYALAHDPEEIVVFDIVKALEGKLSPFYCMGEDGKIYCAAKCHCGATRVLSKVQEAVSVTLKSMNLGELL